MAWRGPSFDQGALRPREGWWLAQGHTVAAGRAELWTRILTVGHGLSPQKIIPPLALAFTSCTHIITPGSPPGSLGASSPLHNQLTIPPTLQSTSALRSCLCHWPHILLSPLTSSPAPTKPCHPHHALDPRSFCSISFHFPGSHKPSFLSPLPTLSCMGLTSHPHPNSSISCRGTYWNVGREGKSWRVFSYNTTR